MGFIQMMSSIKFQIKSIFGYNYLRTFKFNFLFSFTLYKTYDFAIFYNLNFIQHESHAQRSSERKFNTFTEIPKLIN